jgi:hypothetical protein
MPFSSEIIHTPEQKSLIKEVSKRLRKAEEIVEISCTAPEIERDPDEGLKFPPGMSVREKNIIMDSLRPAKGAPLYLTEAYRAAELSRKIESGMAEENTLAKPTYVLIQALKYEEKDVTPRGNVIDVEAK